MSKAYSSLVCALAFALAACSGADVADEGAVERVQSAIQPGDTTHQVVFANADTPAECDLHDGFTSYTSGTCEIYVQQQCEIINNECRCKVRVMDTINGQCGNKQWRDFFPTP